MRTQVALRRSRHREAGRPLGFTRGPQKLQGEVAIEALLLHFIIKSLFIRNVQIDIQNDGLCSKFITTAQKINAGDLEQTTATSLPILVMDAAAGQTARTQARL